MLMSILTYACEIRDCNVARELKQLNMKILKIVLYVHKNTSTATVYGELGEYPRNIVINTTMVGFWSRLITVKTIKLSMIMYTI